LKVEAISAVQNYKAIFDRGIYNYLDSNLGTHNILRYFGAVPSEHYANVFLHDIHITSLQKLYFLSMSAVPLSHLGNRLIQFAEHDQINTSSLKILQQMDATLTCTVIPKNTDFNVLTLVSTTLLQS
jgi:hypothetical protein